MNILQEKPVIGIMSTLTGSFIAYIKVLTPVLSFAGLVIGLLIGIITLILKWNELKEKRRKK